MFVLYLPAQTAGFVVLVGFYLHLQLLDLLFGFVVGVDAALQAFVDLQALALQVGQVRDGGWNGCKWGAGGDVVRDCAPIRGWRNGFGRME